MFKKKSFSIEDPQAVARAVKHSNHPDHNYETEAQPSAGSGVPARKAGASQVAAAGEGIPAGGMGAPKKKMKNTPYSRAVAERNRIVNGENAGNGGWD
jgi:hypothetical protein